MYPSSHKSYTAVNGQSCSYAKLKTYANCARNLPVPAVSVTTTTK